MKKNLFIGILSGIFLLSLIMFPNTGKANSMDVIFDNGLPDHVGLTYLPNSTPSDDFMLPYDAWLTDAHAWIVEPIIDQEDLDSGRVGEPGYVAVIFADNNGEPGITGSDPIGVGNVISKTLVGYDHTDIFFGHDYYENEYTFEISPIYTS